jgi:hypothetical protein
MTLTSTSTEGPEDEAVGDWTLDWQPLVQRVGELLDEPGVRYGPDPVDRSAIRRWLEPLEFDCALHREARVAREHGWPDIIAPYTAVWSFTMPPVWQPGDPPTYPTADRDAQPWRSGISDDVIPGAPPTSAVFGTGISMEFVRPLSLGEQVGAGPRRLVACAPKQTSVGRGAFVTFDRSLLTGQLDVICRVEAQIYLYNPWESQDRDHD